MQLKFSVANLTDSAKSDRPTVEGQSAAEAAIGRNGLAGRYRTRAACEVRELTTRKRSDGPY